MPVVSDAVRRKSARSDSTQTKVGVRPWPVQRTAVPKARSFTPFGMQGRSVQGHSDVQARPRQDVKRDSAAELMADAKAAAKKKAGQEGRRQEGAVAKKAVVKKAAAKKVPPLARRSRDQAAAFAAALPASGESRCSPSQRTTGTETPSPITFSALVSPSGSR
jgi:hypothetical protein